MKKIKTTCHVCRVTMKTPGDQEAPGFCEFCGANLLDPTQEVRILETAIQTAAGGITADVVSVFLTNKRIFFTGDESSGGSGSTVGWLLGGIVGGLIAGAISSAKGRKDRLVSVKFEDMTAIEATFGTQLLNRNRKTLTIHDKENKIYVFQPGKKEVDQWEEEIRQRIPAQQQ